MPLDLERIKQLTESFYSDSDRQPFIVYKAAGKKSGTAYYGYVRGSKEQDAREAFFAGANRNDEGRGTTRLLAQNNDDPDLITFELLDQVDDELEAWMLRNDYRSANADAITGPTMYPPDAIKRAKALAPERVMSWKRKIVPKLEKTARSYVNGNPGFPLADLKAIATTPALKVQVTKDLDQLSPMEFEQKYFPGTNRFSMFSK